MNSLSSFEQKMIVHLHALATVLLAQKMYGRLSMVASLLSGLSSGGWQRLGDEEQTCVVDKMVDDFHVRAWDDWDFRDPTLSAIRELIYAQQRGIQSRAKQGH